ncbi:MAG: peptidyl-prolyl cis-trans isomerase [Prevotellaceae bacterium]|nr:peptidyl-prolyl cis-trans isomerase [Prevotellaceae bacterium]
MAKRKAVLLTLACMLLPCGLSFAQRSGTVPATDNATVLRVGGEEVRLQEFEYRYRRELKQDNTLSADDFADKLALLKLESAAARAAGMDTLAAYREACEAYRHRLDREYLSDNEGTTREARRLYDTRQEGGQTARILVSTIFQRLPQDISQARLQQVEQRFDSLYNLLVMSASDTLFEACVARFSDEKAPFYVSSTTATVEFEETVFNLPEGTVSKPFYTPRGIHIAKVLERLEPPAFEEVQAGLEQRISGFRRVTPGLKARVEALKQAYRYTPDEAGMAEWRRQGSTGHTLFTLKGKAYTGNDFARFAAARPAAPSRQMEEFVAKSVLDYEASRLEADHPDASLRLQCFQEEWLAAKMKARILLPKVAGDEAGLQAFFTKYRNAYAWGVEHYRGAVIHASTKRLLKQARKLLKSLPEAEWENAVRLLFNKEGPTLVMLEQGLFAPGENAYVDENVFKRGKAVPMPSLPYTALMGKREKGPEDYRDVPQAKLLQDYGDYLETRWITGLRASGKVEINQEVLKTVNKN